MTKPELFTDPWARSWRRELTASEAYRSAAKKWEGVARTRPIMVKNHEEPTSIPVP